MLSTILSPFKLIPGFRPLFSGLDVVIHQLANHLLLKWHTSLSSDFENGRLKDAQHSIGYTILLTTWYRLKIRSLGVISYRSRLGVPKVVLNAIKASPASHLDMRVVPKYYIQVID